LFIAAQDSIPQWPIEEVVDVVDTSLKSKFGLHFDDVFDSFESTSLGSASIGQVHKAKLKPKYSKLDGYGGGDIVAVKVMHRGAKERFHHDFQVFRWLCKIALKGWEPILDECYRQIMSEFDYRKEADSLALVRENMANSPFQRQIRIPEPLSNLCTKDLLIMEMLEGKKLSDALEDELALALGGKDKAEAMIKRKRLGK
jgi:predicted unusual protein kinase regulating ubiquinone biosynthesis (AarF/ABC1/UbiB family)